MSQIAMANAFFRARETSLPAPERILEDPYALSLVRSLWRLQALWAIRRVIPGLSRLFEHLQTVHCVRHAAVDALVREGLASGAKQVVILGAGLDARAARLGGVHPDVRWFEVDRSPYIAHKRDLLAKERVTHVTADLCVPGWEAALYAAGFDPSLSTLWVAEGLIHYLPPDTLSSLLALIRSLSSDPRLVISFIRPDIADRGRASPALARMLKWLGEIPEVFFTPLQLTALAAPHGLRAETWDYAAQVRDFAPAARTRPHGVSQDVARFSLA